MTFVTAKQFNDQFRIFSDTKKTSPEELLRGVNNSVLKAVILRPALCICFAGSVGRAYAAIQALDSELGNSFDIEKVLESLLTKHREGRNDPDFIVATLSPTPALYRISSGAIERDLPVCWIGNYEAFATFQRYLGQMPSMDRDDVPPKLATILNDILKMQMAMKKLVEARAHEDVGEFMIEIGTAPNGFYYERRSMGYPGAPSLRPELPSSIRQAAVAQGSYNFALLTPDDAGIGAVGIHFYEGQFGALFYPIHDEKPVLYRNVSEEEFGSKVLEQFGFQISSGLSG